MEGEPIELNFPDANNDNTPETKDIVEAEPMELNFPDANNENTPETKNIMEAEPMELNFPGANNENTPETKDTMEAEPMELNFPDANNDDMPETKDIVEAEPNFPDANNGNTPETKDIMAADPMELNFPDANNNDTPETKDIMEAKPTELNFPDANNDNTPETKNNGLHLFPVAAGESGVGLPYAPENWPNPGDNWRWRVGKRTKASGHFLDRYLYLPSRLAKKGKNNNVFKSKSSTEQYLLSAFPGADLNAFFDSFSWPIPVKQLAKKTDVGSKEGLVPSANTELSVTDSKIGIVTCRAGNQRCSSLEEAENSPEFMSCDMCCSEPRFCQHCCCILCCQTISSACEGYSFIRCEARVDGGYICGHMAHIDCGIRAYMAGTVEGSIGLDAEYYCRRCDSRTDLVAHVSKLVKACETIDSREDIEMALNAGIRLLNRSRKASAEKMLHRLKTALSKLKEEHQLEDIWKSEDVSSVIEERPVDSEENALLSVTQGEPLDNSTGSPRPTSSMLDPRVQALKLEDDIDEVLQKLRKSQENEYRLAKERLLAQKRYVQALYNEVDRESSELSRGSSLPDSEASLGAVLARVEQLKQENVKLKEMKQVAAGFGRTPNHILKEHFGSHLG